MRIEEISDKELLQTLLDREIERREQLKQCKFEHWEKIKNRWYLISIDNGAVGCQVRLEKYRSKKDYETFDYEELIGIYDSVDDAIIELNNIRNKLLGE